MRIPDGTDGLVLMSEGSRSGTANARWLTVGHVRQTVEGIRRWEGWRGNIAEGDGDRCEIDQPVRNSPVDGIASP